MVKSRLTQYLNEDVVLSLYKNFVLDLLETLKKSRHQFKIYFFPSNAKQKVSDWLGNDYSYMPQKGEDLGERMKNAFLKSFTEGGFSKVILIGSDIPDITNTVLDKAFEFDDFDAVIGPASDGGYYLIGFKKDTFLPELFDDMPWGTETVFKKTMDIFRGKNYTVHILPEWRDIDRLADLKALFERNRNTEFIASRTMNYISAHYRTIFK